MTLGRSRRRKLLLIAPPGTGKSTWLSLIFPPWYLGNHPSESLLFFTSSDTMARQFGGTVKAVCEGNKLHRAAFPAEQMEPDFGRGWSTDGLYLRGVPDGSKDPSYRAVGYGASVVGAHAHGIILDDPLTQEQAQSEIEQLKAKQYHDLTVDSRLHPGGWEIAIMTRWHELDLAAHLMAKAEWDVELLPALAGEGDPMRRRPGAALWPERFSRSWFEAKRAEIGVPLFNCLYQGDPMGLGGLVFKEAGWFRDLPVDFDEPRQDGRSMRDRLTILQFWDLAFSKLDTADYTVGITVGIDALRNLYILDVVRRRMSGQETETAIVEEARRHQPAMVGVEESAFRQVTVQTMLQRVRQRVVLAIQAIRPSADKVMRAQLPAGRAEAGCVYVDKGAPWWPAFLSECLSFPLGAHDDQVDAFSGVAQMAAAIETERPLPVKMINPSAARSAGRRLRWGERMSQRGGPSVADILKETPAWR